MTPRTFPIVSMMAAALCAPCMAQQPASVKRDDILREGGAERRAILDAMELKPFDRSLLTGLKDWSLGGPVGPDDIAGKVVLLYTWTNYLDASVGPMRALSRLVETHGPRGLVVIGVHADEAYAAAADVAQRRRANFPIARDAGGELRRALRVDSDPDFYLIDRAGQLRMADVDNAAIGAAVELLINETSDAASSILSREDQARSRAAQEAGRLSVIRSQVSLDDLPAIPFRRPGPEAYRNPGAPGWPTLRFQRQNQNFGGSNTQPDDGPPPPPPEIQIGLPSNETWHGQRPADLEGKVRMFLVIAATEESFGGDFAPFYKFFEDFQRRHQRDLAMVAVAVVPGQIIERGRAVAYNPGPVARGQIKQRLAAFAAERNLMYPIVDGVDDDAFFEALQASDVGSSRNFGGSQESGAELPFIALVSTDGLLRWRGSIRVGSPSVTLDLDRAGAALTRMLQVDPGVRARQEAERRFLSGEADLQTLRAEAGDPPADGGSGGNPGGE